MAYLLSFSGSEVNDAIARVMELLSAEDILAELKSVDGSGSGLDADAVDGFHAAASAAPGVLLALNASSKLPASITGDAASVGGLVAERLFSLKNEDGDTYTYSGNLNDLLGEPTRLYYAAAASTNKPTAGGGFLLHLRATSGTEVQLFWQLSAPHRAWARTYGGSSWEQWHRQGGAFVVQTVTGSLGASDTQANHTISAVDLDSTFVVVGWQTSATSFPTAQVRAYLTSSTNLRVQRDSSGNTVTYNVYVIESP